MIAYVSIGNSDDKLTQRDWALFYSDTAVLLQRHASTIHGQWASEPASAWQNACWCIEVNSATKAEYIKAELVGLAGRYRQDSIAWAEVKGTEFLGAGEVQGA